MENWEKRIGLQFFAEKGLSQQDSRFLRKGIRTFEIRIQEHERYLRNPASHVENWESLPKQHQEALLKHWRKEIQNFRESIQNRKEELRKRGEENAEQSDGGQSAVYHQPPD